jgi:hypothetical protein
MSLQQLLIQQGLIEKAANPSDSVLDFRQGQRFGWHAVKVENASNPWPGVLNVIAPPPGGYLQFPDPRDASVNNSQILLRSDLADAIYKHRCWPGTAGSELDLLIGDRAEHRMNWFRLVAFKAGWNQVEFSGKQVLLSAIVRLVETEPEEILSEA